MAIALAVAVATAAAQEEPLVTFEEPSAGTVAVIGRDAVISVRARLPEACAGEEAEVALYTRNGPTVGGLMEGTSVVSTRVSAEGNVLADIPLPTGQPEDLLPAWPGVSANCLNGVVVSQSIPVHFGVLDEEANEGNRGTFVIPAAALTTPDGRPVVTTLTVLVDGTVCTIVDVVASAAQDPSGKARLVVGGPDQPSACSREGATVRFALEDGRLLFEQRVFRPGVTQPLANLAPEATSTGPVAPAPPNTGSVDSMGENGGGFRLRIVVALVAFVVAALAYTMLRRTGR